MSFLDDLDITESPINGPYFGIVYGHSGVGKTFLCAHAEKPVYIPLEKGVERVPNVGKPVNKSGEIVMPRSTDEFFQLLQWATKHPNGYKTIVIDSGMFADKIMIEGIIAKTPKVKKGDAFIDVESIADYHYGEGYAKLLALWESRFFNALNFMHKRGLNVILIAHARERNTRDTSGDEFKKWGIDMAQFGQYSVPNLLSAKADFVLFMQSSINTRKKANQFGGARTVADRDEQPEIIIYTRGSSAFDAKVRTEKMENVQDQYIIDPRDPETSKQLFRDLEK